MLAAEKDEIRRESKKKINLFLETWKSAVEFREDAITQFDTNFQEFR